MAQTMEIEAQIPHQLFVEKWTDFNLLLSGDTKYWKGSIEHTFGKGKGGAQWNTGRKKWQIPTRLASELHTFVNEANSGKIQPLPEKVEGPPEAIDPEMFAAFAPPSGPMATPAKPKSPKAKAVKAGIDPKHVELNNLLLEKAFAQDEMIIAMLKSLSLKI